MTAEVRKTTATTIQFGSGATVGDLIRALEEEPDGARISVKHFNGDQRDPAQTTLTITDEGN